MSNNINPQGVINDIMRLRESGKFTDKKIAEFINDLYGTVHTSESVRAIRRRQESKKTVEKTPAVKHLDYKFNVSVTAKGNVMFISDTHAPFVLEGAIDFLVRTRRRFNISKTFHIGDLNDEYALSFFDKDPAALGPQNELEKAREFNRILKEEFPELDICIGNHDNRHLRVAAKAGLPTAYIRDFSEIYDTPDTWRWNYSYILNENILVEHGTASGMKATYDRAVMSGLNVVQGHTHNYGGVLHINDGRNSRWALNVGTLADQSTYAMRYSLTRPYQHTYGVGVIYDGIPMFIPYDGR
jgi:predicted phosphodiesterase